MNDSLNILLSATLDKDKSIDNINSKIKEIQKGLKELNISLDIGDLKKQFKDIFGEMTNEAEKQAKKASDQINKEMEKIKFLDPKNSAIGFEKAFSVDEFKKNIQELRKEIRSIENIKVNYGKDNTGEGIGKIDSVLVQYKDKMGQLVNETIAWADITDEQGKVVAKRWQTISLSIEENRKRMNDLQQTVKIFKDSMGHKLDMLEQLKEVDPARMEALRSQLNNISAESGAVQAEMKAFSLEVQKLGDSSKSVKQMENLANAVSIFKEKANFKLDLLESTKNVDSSKIEALRNAVNGVDASSALATQQMKELNFEIQKVSSTSEKYADKQKALSSLENKRIQVNKKLADLMNNTRVKDSKKNDLSKEYALIEKEMKKMAKTSENVTQAEVNGLQQRMTKLKQLVEAEGRYQKQLSNREAISRTKGNLLSQVESIREQGIIDPTVLDGLVKQIKNVKATSTDADDSLKGIGQTVKELARTSEAEFNKIKKSQSTAFNLDEFKKVQLNRLDLLKGTSASITKIQELKKAVNSLSADMPDLSQRTKSLANDITILGSQSRKTGEFMQLFTRYFGLYEGIQIGKQVISSMVTEIKNLDEALIELRKVTDFSEQGLNSFTETAFKTANEIGRTGTEMVNASAEFARAGYAEDELMELAKTSLMMTNIGDGIQDVAEASGYLISALKAYRLEASQAIDVTSAINEVSNNNAIGFQKLAEGLSRTASVYSQAGTSMEEVLGLLTGAYEINRNIEKTSSGLITISTRLRSIQLEGEEAVIPIAKLQDMFSSIAGVDIMNKQTGQLRDTFDILKDLAEVWDTLDANMQESLAFASAGTRQKSVFLDLMNNFEAVEKAIDNAENSMGSALRENEVFMDSIQGKVNQLQTAWQQLSTTTISSDFVKSLVDGATQIVKFADACGGLLPVVIALGTAFALLKFTPLISGLETLSLTIAGMIPVCNTLTGSVIALNTVLKFSVAGLAVGAIMAIAYGLDYLSHSTERAKEKVDALNEELSTLTKDRSSATGLAKEFEALSEKQRLSNAEQERFVEIQNSLKEVMPEINGYYDEQGNFIVTETDLMTKLNTVYDELIAKKRAEKAEQAQGLLGDYAKTYEKDKKAIANMEESLDMYKRYKEGMKLTEDEMNQMNVLLQYENIDSLISTMEGNLNSLRTSVSETTKGIRTSIMDCVYGTEAWTNATEVQKKVMSEWIGTLSEDELQEYNKALSSGALSGDEFVQSLLESPRVQKQVEYATKSLGATVDGVIPSFTNLKDTIGKLSEEFDTVSGNIEGLRNVLDDLKEGNGLTADSMSTIISTYPELLQYIDDEIQLKQAIIDKIHEQEQVQVDSINYIRALQSENFGSMEREIADYYNQLGIAYNVDFENYKSMEQAKASITSELISSLNEEWSEYYGVVSKNLGKSIQGIHDMSLEDYKNLSQLEKDQMKALENKQRGIKDQIDSIFEKYKVDPVEIVLDSGKKSKKSGSKNKSKLNDAFKEQLTVIQKVRKGIEAEIDKLKAKMELSELKGDTKLLEEYQALMVELLQKRQVAVEDENKAYRKLQADIQKKTKSANAEDLATLRDHLAQIEDLMTSNSSEWWDIRKGVYEEELALLEMKYEVQSKILDEKDKELELQKVLLEAENPETREAYLEIERQIYEAILQRQEMCKQKLQEYYDLGLDLDSEYVKEAKETYYDLEKQRLEWIKERAESERQYQQETIKTKIETLEKEKDAIKELTDLVVEMLKHEATQRKENLKEELDGYKKIIDAKKEILDQEKEQHDYNKGLKEKQKKITSVENQLLELSYDNSAKAQAQRAKLEEELLKLKEELQEYQYEQSLDNQKDALDKEYEAFEDNINEQIKDIDDYLDREGALREEATKLIEKQQRSLYDKLIKWGTEYGDLTTAEIKGIWENGFDALEKYEGGQQNVLGTLNNIIESLRELNIELQGIEDSPLSNFVGELPTIGGGGHSDSSGSSATNKWTLEEAKKDLQLKQQKYLHAEMLKAKKEGNKGLENWIKGERKRWGLNSDTGAIEKYALVPEDEWEKKKKNYGFKRGGETQLTGLHWLDGEQGKPERVLSAEQTQAFNKLVDIAPTLNRAIDKMLRITENGQAIEKLIEVVPAVSSISQKILDNLSDSNGQENVNVSLNFDSMVNIEGDVDKDVDLESIIKKASQKVVENLESTLANMGIGRKVNFR